MFSYFSDKIFTWPARYSYDKDFAPMTTLREATATHTPEVGREKNVYDVEAHEWDCWRTATTIAEWCGALDLTNFVMLSKFQDDWRMPIPEDLHDMLHLYYHRTWEILEAEYKIHMVRNSHTDILLELSVHHRMNKLLK